MAKLCWFHKLKENECLHYKFLICFPGLGHPLDIVAEMASWVRASSIKKLCFMQNKNFHSHLVSHFLSDPHFWLWFLQEEDYKAKLMLKEVYMRAE